MRRSTMLAFALLASALVTACGEPFDPRNELTRYQVLGIVADKPQPAPDDEVRLAAHDFVPAGETSTYRWAVCLYSYGSSVAYECADPRLEVPVAGAGAEVVLDLGPDGLNLRALYDQFGPVPGLDGEPVTLEDGIDVWVKLKSGPDGDVQSVKKLTVRDGGAPNKNPAIVKVEAGSREAPADAPLEVRAGSTVPIRLTTSADSVESFEDEDTGETRDEELLYTYFTTGGSFAPGATYGDDADADLELPEEPGDVTVYVAVRDGRGGLDIVQRTLRVTLP
jgi:hypothetical protein